jgi:cytochrome c553
MRTRVCPKCLVNPPRHQVLGSKVAMCVACWKVSEAAHQRATLAARLVRRVAAKALIVPVCPTCGVNPPRYPPVRLSAIPACEACHEAKWARKYQAVKARVNDISAAEIERRFQLALKQTRQRTWTSAHSS